MAGFYALGLDGQSMKLALAFEAACEAGGDIDADLSAFENPDTYPQFDRCGNVKRWVGLSDVFFADEEPAADDDDAVEECGDEAQEAAELEDRYAQMARDAGVLDVKVEEPVNDGVRIVRTPTTARKPVVASRPVASAQSSREQIGSRRVVSTESDCGQVYHSGGGTSRSWKRGTHCGKQWARHGHLQESPRAALLVNPSIMGERLDEQLLAHQALKREREIEALLSFEPEFVDEVFAELDLVAPMPFQVFDQAA